MIWTFKDPKKTINYRKYQIKTFLQQILYNSIGNSKTFLDKFMKTLYSVSIFVIKIVTGSPRDKI